MALRKLAKDRNSGKHGCPTVYADDGVKVETEQVLVLQGDVVVESEALDDHPVAPEATRCVWLADDTVLALGDRLSASRERELEHVLPSEAAVSLLARELFSEPRLEQAEDLGVPRVGQVLLRIKAETVRAARARYHEEAS